MKTNAPYMMLLMTACCFLAAGPLGAQQTPTPTPTPTPTQRFEALTPLHQEYTRYDQYYSPGIWNDKAMVYAAPDSNAAIIDSIAFGTKVFSESYLRNAPLENGEHWHELKLENDASGFVKATQVYSHSNSFYLNRKYYFLRFGIHEYTERGYNFRIIFKPPAGPSSELIIPGGRLYYHIELAPIFAFDGNHAFFKLNFVHRESCPGVNDDRWLIMSESGIDTLISSYSTGESTWHDEERVYLPIRLGNGEILHVRDGNLQRAIDPHDGSMDTVSIPASIGAELQNVFVRIFESAEAIDPEDNANRPEMKIHEYREEYYRWNGSSVEKLNVKP